MSFTSDYGRDRTSDAPISMDLSDGMSLPQPQPAGFAGLANLAARLGIPQSWVGMSGYLVAGIFLGLVLILALSIGRGGEAAAATGPNAVVDNVVRLHAQEIGSSCWQGYDKLGPARLTVALEVGIDGKIRYAAASGETPAMRSCVEQHVNAWEFLPQQQAQTMALPFEIDRR
ncbi:MAG: hypothetical protein KF764_01245 [Labilithrix sp.]|nr:hypothetical protein [Labilithrix sp.]MBX3203656.1 hypothetical protein [Labilithrix sp.]MBX3222066.1 hypothetical protein [Labilithrix sp.]